MTESFVESTIAKRDEHFEEPLRPNSLGDFIGQEAIRERLDVMIGAAKQRGEPLGHCLFSGPPGLGKTTLAHILANSMGTKLTVTSGPAVEKPGDLAGVLTSLQEGDVLFIDELHRLNRAIEEYLYSAMEDFMLDLLIDSGPSARSVQVKLNRFTLAGATTRLGLITAPMRSRFAFSCRLEHYPSRSLQEIIVRTGRILNVPIEERAAAAIAGRARGTPRIANNLLRWVRDYAQMKNDNVIDEAATEKAIAMLEIDALGLDEMDRKILEVIIDNYGGGPVGVNTISVAVGEESHTLEEVYEPFLIMLGLLKRTPRGREATAKAYSHLKKNKEGELPL